MKAKKFAACDSRYRLAAADHARVFAHRRPALRNLSLSISFSCLTAAVILCTCAARGAAQLPGQLPDRATVNTAQLALEQPQGSAGLPDGVPVAADGAPSLPSAAADPEQEREIRPWDVTPDGQMYQQPFSRIGLGTSLSPLGIGANATTVLTQYIDARLSGNFFEYNNGRTEVDGFNVYAGLHLASAVASVDIYPFNAPIRFSGGLMFYNVNHASGNMRVAPGSNFTLNGDTFYAGGATTPPLTGSAAIGFHSIRPAPTLTFGFGKFVPRSDRHWSFPSEFGVAFTGAPSINVKMAGTACTDQELSMCANVADTSNPVGAEFNSALQAKLASWRRSLGKVQIFPIISGGVSFSFNTPWQGTPRPRVPRF